MSVGIDMFRTIQVHTDNLDTTPIPASSNSTTVASLVNDCKHVAVEYFASELKKFEHVISYCNNQLAIVSTTYSCVVPTITSTFTLKSAKFTNKNIVQSEFGEINLPTNLYPEGEGAV